MERYRFNIIKDEIQFENFSRDFVKLLYPAFTFQLYGKKGQSQFGIDGHSTSGDIYFQSKHKSKETIKDQIIIEEINNELNKAKTKMQESCQNRECKYLFFSTHKQSAVIQDEAKKLSSEKIIVEYWGWETIESYLNDFYNKDNRDFFSKYYPEIAKNLDSFIPKQLSIKSSSQTTGFIGRENELKKIDSILKTNKTLLINGIGGIGKSSLANHYVTQNKDSYDYYGLFDDISSMISDLKLILNLKSEIEPDILKEAIVALRKLNGRKLFVIDNILDINSINILLSLKDYGFTLLLTSRETIDTIECFELSVMSLDDAKNLFNSIYKIEDTLLEQILNYLDNHTFFIEKIAKTLSNKDSLTPEKILEYFQNGEFSKIKMNRKESFKKLLDELFTIDGLENEEILALKQISIFPSAFILFRDLKLILQKEDETDFEDMLNYLSEKGWLIKYNDGSFKGYKLHQINKEYLFSSHTPSFEDIKIPLTFYNLILQHSVEIEVSLDHKNRLIFFESLYKFLKVLNIYNQEVFIFFQRIGNVYLHLGNINLSLEVFHRALEISNEINDLHKMHTAEVYSSLGEIYRRLGDYANAMKYMEESILISEQYLDENSLALAGQYSNRGHLYKTFGQIDKSFEYFSKALKIMELYESNPKESFVYKGIAEAYQIKQQYDKALDFFKKALNSRKKFFKDDNPLIAQSYNDLGFIYAKMDQREKALPFYIEAMNRYEITLGEEHIDTASVYNNLGELYRYTKKYSKAYPLIKKAMNIREIQQGAYALDTAMSYNTMGVYNADIGEYNESIEYLTKSFNILNATLGPNHIYTIQTQENIHYTHSLMIQNNIKKIGRNDACSCGSGKKYKKCCGIN
ncbi:tetratricopeptide repeat protein [Sulfurospirillum halorespirans]|uniref:Uncharacterized protein n=1 Tax=Sulfurospirillum halorespirans DSM 13726 TaxID=1193502 RepID=A0A1D7TFR9_9BACT|nr:tetratricopeptide repeat protein [Sulfurospirillum halorespirans]AOO63862.1 hypothetical protein SHALO_0060 [Sulfurospirillum halorespirans DSM 13726]